jgi:hypothetical protein
MPRAGTTTARGYGSRHKGLRKWWARRIDGGTVICWRCHRRITRDDPWHLGHDDNDRARYRGPEHERCSTEAARRLQLEAQRGTGVPAQALRDEPLEANEW